MSQIIRLGFVSLVSGIVLTLSFYFIFNKSLVCPKTFENFIVNQKLCTIINGTETIYIEKIYEQQDYYITTGYVLISGLIIFLIAVIIIENSHKIKKIKKMNVLKVPSIRNSTDICPICLELLSSRKHIVTNCGHYFHESCLNNWNGDCPVCRQNLQNI